jgi:hypothetical protein
MQPANGYKNVLSALKVLTGPFSVPGFRLNFFNILPRRGMYNKFFASYSGCRLARYCSQSFLIAFSRGVKENPGRAFNNLLLSK